MARILQASALALFPCKPNTKIPATKNGFKDAKMDFDAKSYLEKGYNIGLACSQSGFYASDRNKIIHEHSFLSYARNHKRFRYDNHGVRYGSAKKVMSSLCFDVTDIEEFTNLNLGTYNSL